MSSALAKPTQERSNAMAKRPNPSLIDEDNPEWSREDLARARPAAEVLPEIMGAALAAEMLQPKKPGRPKAPSPKVPTAIRLDADVLEVFKSQGRGWQTRINQALREWLEAHPAA